MLVHDIPAACLDELGPGGPYRLTYLEGYAGPPVSLTLPLRPEPYELTELPAFFDGLLPEGPNLEALLKLAKLDARDYFGQLVTVGGDLVGAVTVEELAAGDVAS